MNETLAARSTSPAVKSEAKSKLHPCECSQWERVLFAGTEEANLEDYKAERTVCNAQTKRTFAQGHDARLKSLLIEAGVEGQEVARHGDDDGIRREMAWDMAATQFGFGYQVLDAVSDRLDKGNKKAAKAAKEITAKKAPKDGGRAAVEGAVKAHQAKKAGTVQIKVGRWTYEANQVAGGYRYTSKDGAERIVPADKAKLV